MEEVEALIPTLNHLVGEQLLRQAEIERVLRELARVTGEVPSSLAIEPSDGDPVRTLKMELKACVSSYERGWEDVQELGAVVKDPTAGLLDFYGRVDGRLVWLCWRYGEDSLGYFHELDAGFSGRRPLEGKTRERLLN